MGTPSDDEAEVPPVDRIQRRHLRILVVDDADLLRTSLMLKLATRYEPINGGWIAGGGALNTEVVTMVQHERSRLGCPRSPGG